MVSAGNTGASGWDTPSGRARVLHDGGEAAQRLFATYRDGDRHVVSFTRSAVFELADDLPRGSDALHAWLAAATNVTASRP